MAKIDPKLVEGIHRSLVSHILEHYKRYYYLAYSLVKNREGATKTVTKAVYFSLFNGRKLKELPPMHVWILQLVIKDGMRAMNHGTYSREFTKGSQLYAYMETLEPSAVNTLKLYYFEELSMEKVGDVLNFKKEEVQRRLSYVRNELKIESSMDEDSEIRIQELKSVYESPEIPENLLEEVEQAIRKEADNYASLLTKYQKDRIRKPIKVLIFAAVFFFGTVYLGKTNAIFAESVLNLPLISKLFIPFF